MEITADTNLFIRAITNDDDVQSPIARAALADAELVAVGLSTMCEMVWVLSAAYKFPSAGISATIRKLINAPNIVADDQAIQSGLDLMDAGGDFADGVIAYEGRKLGGAEFVSFDKTAVKLLLKQGKPARLLF